MNFQACGALHQWPRSLCDGGLRGLCVCGSGLCTMEDLGDRRRRLARKRVERYRRRL